MGQEKDREKLREECLLTSFSLIKCWKVSTAESLGAAEEGWILGKVWVVTVDKPEAANWKCAETLLDICM